MTQPVEARIITALRPESSMPIRAGSLTLKMTPSFIRAHGTVASSAGYAVGARGRMMRAEAGFGTMIFRAAWDKIQSIIGNVMDYDRIRAIAYPGAPYAQVYLEAADVIGP